MKSVQAVSMAILLFASPLKDAWGEDKDSPPEILFDLSGEEIPQDIQRKLFAPLNAWLERSKDLKLEAEQDLVVVRHEKPPTIFHTDILSVQSKDGDREYFSSVTSRVDSPSKTEIAMEIELRDIREKLKISRPSIQGQSDLFDRMTKISKSIISPRPSGAFCDTDSGSVMSLLPSLNRQRVGRSDSRRQLNYARYRRFPIVTASEVFYTRTPNAKDNDSYLVDQRPTRVLVFSDGSTRAFWSNSEIKTWSMVEFDASIDGLPVHLSAGNDDHPKSPLISTRTTWGKDEFGRWEPQSAEASYARKNLHPNTTGIENIVFTLDFKWTRISETNRKRYLTAEEVHPHLKPVAQGESDNRNERASQGAK